MPDLNESLRIFEATEANLVKLEELTEEIDRLTPTDLVFGSDPAYENAVRSYEHLLAALPHIGGWKPSEVPVDLNTIAQWRFDAQEVGEPSGFIAVENAIAKPGEELREYRFRFDQRRRALVREAIAERSASMASVSSSLWSKVATSEDSRLQLDDRPEWKRMRELVSEIDTLLGSIPRPQRWSALLRHLHFAMLGDLHDIVEMDWPAVSEGLTKSLFAENEAIPVGVADLDEVMAPSATGTLDTVINWESLDAGSFEMLIYALISNEAGYENVDWLMHTNAPDRGRDVSAWRSISDSLSGVRRERIIVQCKHVRSRSISLPEISSMLAQMRLWEPPRVDELIVATSGWFSSDAVAWVEQHNQSSAGTRIVMWAHSHLEALLARRPALIAGFGLR